MNGSRFTRLAIAVLLSLPSACGRGEDPAINTTGTVSPRVTPTGDAGGQDSAAAPSLTIDTPDDGAQIPAGNVEVRVTPADFQIVNKLGRPAAKGEGHVHFYMDVENVPTEQGKPAVSAQGTYHATATPSYTWPDVTPGEHTFSAQLVNNDHTPLSPPVVRTIKVTAT